MRETVVLPDELQQGLYAVSDRHFGSNLVFQYEKIGNEPWAKYDEVIAAVGATNIRYPGGSGAETLFDIAQPDAASGVENGQTVDLVGLTDFLGFAAARNLGATIILPTARFLTSDAYGGRSFDTGWTAAIHDLVVQSLSQSPGHVAAFEIGNEYESYMTSAEYGRLASAVALIVENAISDYAAGAGLGAAWDRPEIAVQIWGDSAGGNTSMAELQARNRTVLAQFDAAELAAVDAVDSHFYYSQGRHAGDINEHSLANLDTIAGLIGGMMDAWDAAAGRDLDHLISEWNVQARSTTNIGLEQAPALLEMFTDFVNAGMDGLDFWSAQYQATSLADKDGDLMTAGVIFKLLADLPENSRPLTSFQHDDAVMVHGFASDSSMTVFISSMVDEDIQVAFDPGASFDDYFLFSADLVGVDASTADGSYRDLTGLAPYEEPDASVVVEDLPAWPETADNDVLQVLAAHDVLVLRYAKIPEAPEAGGAPGDDAYDFTTIIGNFPTQARPQEAAPGFWLEHPDHYVDDVPGGPGPGSTDGFDF